MGISVAVYDAYVSEWRRRLRENYRPYRQRWPGHLFHHAPLENVVKILTNGELLSRNHAKEAAFLDVAGAGIIDHRNDAHNYGRLYFRPRTPTQYSIEGIRKLSDVRFNAHAPTLYMLVFDARCVLTIDSTECSNGNMQSWGTAHEPSEEFFAGLPFTEIYHEGSVGFTPEILHRRCAEVLVQSPFRIKQSLKFIYCRSPAERDMLSYELGPVAAQWIDRMIISDDLNVFEKRYSFIQTVDIGHSGVTFKVHPRSDNQEIELRLRIKHGQELISDDTFSRLPAVSKSGSSIWIKRAHLADGDYRVRIDIEGHKAYINSLTLGDALF
jgi:hypothetical protein